MYNIIPLLLILISLIIVIIIAIKKFPVLANLNLESIPAEKEAKFKERIISNKLKRNFIRWGMKFLRLLKPAGEAIRNFFNWLYNKLIELREEYKKEKTDFIDAGLKTQELFKEFEELKEKGDLAGAEKKLIDIIGFDNKNIRAFKILGCLYFEQKNYEEARQTFEYILKLKENIEDDDIYGKSSFGQGENERRPELNFRPSDLSQIYLDLALTFRALDNLESAVESLKKALKIEPSNPRYLDTMLEISIMIKDKILALETYNKLKTANPENKKLEEIKKEIDEMQS
jgi:tetratricopeptide (TPR) repeat protein